MQTEVCMKCGRELKDQQVFCEKCLADMEQHPVKPGVVVLLPQRQQTQKPTSRRKHPAAPPEEQIKKLRKTVLRLRIALTVALAAMCVMAWLAVSQLLEKQEVKPLPGQNYSSDASPSSGTN